MLKKYFLVLFLFFYSVNCHANIFDDMIDAMCNIGQDKITESWSDYDNINGRNKKGSFKSNGVCPPWNKNAGRAGTCLQKFDYPGRFIGFYLNSCAEDTKENIYFKPKIQIRTQTCNAAACWSQSTTLNWDGQCVVWPGAYALPLLRICARIANPAVPAIPGDKLHQLEAPADHGYTKGVHLDFIGQTVRDAIIIGVDGKEIQYSRPKLCAYSDPGLVNLISATGVHTDLFDWNPVSQPLHRTTKLHVIAEVLKFLVQANEKIMDMLTQLIGILGDGAGVKVIKSVFSAFGKLLELFHAPVIFVINTFGSLNSAVDDPTLGCVEIPMGPYPPPYCNPLAPFKPMPTTEYVCANDKEKSTLSNKCVVAEDAGVVNNFIHNTIRITLDDFIGLCDPKDKTVTDKCVRIRGAISPFIVHSFTNNKDIISLCSSETEKGPCVEGKIPLNCGARGKPPCVNKFRVVYVKAFGKAETAAETAPPSNYYVFTPKKPDPDPDPDADSGLYDCDGTAKTCQKIWGVNIGEFKDVSLSFKAIDERLSFEEIADGKGDLSYTTKFVSRDSKTTRTFETTIVRNSTSKQQSTDICVYEGQDLVGCEKREPFDKVAIFNCGDENAPSVTGCAGGIKENYFQPRLIASIKSKDGKYSTSRLVQALSVQAPDATDYKINLAGYNFSSFVAYMPDNPTINDHYLMKPFSISESRSITPLSIYGTYKGLFNVASKPSPSKYEANMDFGAIYRNKGYSAKTTLSPFTKYIKGFEYINDRYIRGGTHICLTPEDISHCPLNEKNCVLTKLSNIDSIDCKRFNEKQREIPNLRLCNDEETLDSCTSETIESIIIYGCTDTIDKQEVKRNCYKNTKNTGEVCKLTMDVANRILPEPDKGKILDDTLYYKTSIATSSAKPTVTRQNDNIVNCDMFDAAKSVIPGLRLCTDQDSLSNCKEDQKIVGLDKGVGITIKQCTNVNCYINNVKPDTEICVKSEIDSTTYNPSTQAIRDKTSEELGLCLKIPEPECAAITIATDQTGNATWEKAKIGEISHGTCKTDWELIDPSKPLERYCIADPQKKDIVLGDLDKDVGCKAAKIEFTCEHNDFGDIKTSKNFAGFEFGTSPDINTFSVGTGQYLSNLSFNIKNKDSLEYFRLTSLSYDDYALVIVNNNIVGGGSDENLSLFKYYNQAEYRSGILKELPDAGRFIVEKNINIDLLPNLKNGDNIIVVNLIVIGGGGLYYKIEYKFKE